MIGLLYMEWILEVGGLVRESEVYEIEVVEEL